MNKIDVANFTKACGDPNKFFSGIRWFDVDGKRVQIYAPSWTAAQKLILQQYPNSKIELLVK